MYLQAKFLELLINLGSYGVSINGDSPFWETSRFVHRTLVEEQQELLRYLMVNIMMSCRFTFNQR